MKCSECSADIKFYACELKNRLFQIMLHHQYSNCSCKIAITALRFLFTNSLLRANQLLHGKNRRRQFFINVDDCLILFD